MKRLFCFVVVLVAVCVANAALGTPVGGEDEELVFMDGPALSDLLADDYVGTLTVSINGQKASEGEERIVIDKRSGGDAVGLWLENFKLSVFDGTNTTLMYIGDIYVSNVALAEEDGVAYFYEDQNVRITEGDNPKGVVWLGPLMGDVPVSVSGQGSKTAFALVVDIRFVSVGLTVQAVFNSKVEEAVGIVGVENASETKLVGCRSALPDGVYSLGGQRLTADVSDLTAMPKGVYVVCDNGIRRKVVVK